MFTKSIFLILFTSTLILASPIQENQALKVNRSILGTVVDWLQKADKAISDVYDRVKQPFKKVIKTVIETGEGVVDYGKEKVNQLLEKYHELKRKSEENVNKAKNAFLVKVINELQKVVDTLTNEADGETLEKLKIKTKEIAESSKEALKKLEQQLQEAIYVEKQKLEQNLDRWEAEANAIVKNKRL